MKVKQQINGRKRRTPLWSAKPDYSSTNHHIDSERQKRRTDQSLPREIFLCNDDRRITACHGPQVVSSQQLRLLMEVCRRAAKITSNIDKTTIKGTRVRAKHATPKPLKRLFSILARQACGTRPSVAMTPARVSATGLPVTELARVSSSRLPRR